MRTLHQILLFAALVSALPQGRDSSASSNEPLGGVFGIDFRNIPPSMGSGSAISRGKEGSLSLFTSSTGGSGPFKAQQLVDDSLPTHTIYAPVPAASEPLPVIVFGNGGCLRWGGMFSQLHEEIASHGFLVIANGGPSQLRGLVSSLGPTTKPREMIDAIDWVEANEHNSTFLQKYGRVDASKIAVMGQSCGGLEAYSASLHESRIRHTILLNSGLIDRTKEFLLQELKSPVAFFLGGLTDIAYNNGENDYKVLPAGMKKFKASLDMGHLGTWNAPNAGKGGKAVVAYLKWVMKDDQRSRDMLIGPTAYLPRQGWNVTSSGW